MNPNSTNVNLDVSFRSAKAIVPKLLEILPEVSSVVDVGCGVATWLSVFEEHGIEDALGMDGPYVRPTDLNISPSKFTATDLTKPFSVERKYDLAMSLEVAEHLPRHNAEAFISSLTSLSDCIVFSAAIPLQGGQEHVNEAWPSYWIPIFERHGFGAADTIRPLIWNLEGSASYYRQNMALLLFAWVEMTSV